MHTADRLAYVDRLPSRPDALRVALMHLALQAEPDTLQHAIDAAERYAHRAGEH